jgi:hypothetical protein
MCQITKKMMGKPIGMFHCPITLEMVLPGEFCHLEKSCKDVIEG